MNGLSIGELIDAMIPMLAGLYATIIGYGFLGQVPGAARALRERHGTMFKVLGPALIAFGTFQLARATYN